MICKDVGYNIEFLVGFPIGGKVGSEVGILIGKEPEFFYDDPKYHATIENIEEKKHFIRKAKMFYFIIDQYVNLTYSNQKPSKLTNQILEKLQRNLNIKDLGSLKMSLKNTKNEINKFLLYVLENNK